MVPRQAPPAWSLHAGGTPGTIPVAGFYPGRCRMKTRGRGS